MPRQEKQAKHDNHAHHVQKAETIKAQVYRLLDKNPLLMAEEICQLLHLNHKKRGDYIRHVRFDWKHDPKKQQGSKCSIHGWRGYTYVPSKVHADIRAKAVKVGWRRTKARNRWLLWKDKLGRLQWFETGRVNLYVRKPVTQGRIFQLVSNGFSWTGLVTDLKVLETMLRSIRCKGAHYVFETKQRLPRMTIDLFNKHNGIVIKFGDKTHPHAVEVIAVFPNWAERIEGLAERNEVLHTRLLAVLERLAGIPGPPERLKIPGPDYAV